MDMTLIDTGRIGIGLIFIFSILLDFKMRPQLFELMAQKKVPMPWLFFIGAFIWKMLTSIGLIFNFYTFYVALLLSLYILIANVIFNNFWAMKAEQRDVSLPSFFIHLAVCFGLLVIAGTS